MRVLIPIILAAFAISSPIPSLGQAVIIQPIDLSNFATKADNTATQASATSAANAAATAQSTANTATTNAATASTAASAAQTTANTGVTNAATAQTTANTGVTNAATAQAKANTSVQTINGVGPIAGASTVVVISNGANRIAALELSHVVQYATPTTGQTVVSDGSGTLAVNPAGALLALTITVPASPYDGQTFTLVSTQAITTLTMNGGTLAGGLTTMGANGGARWLWSATGAQWMRAQ